MIRETALAATLLLNASTPVQADQPPSSWRCYAITFAWVLPDPEDIVIPLKPEKTVEGGKYTLRFDSRVKLKMALRADGVWVLPDKDQDLEMLASLPTSLGCIAGWMLEHRDETRWMRHAADTDGSHHCSLLDNPNYMPVWYHSAVARHCPLTNDFSPGEES